ncbi:MAG: transcriptional regulator [Sediminibacterium sp.]|nr:transcriptional regulator [Sediminibacterium sp.]
MEFEKAKETFIQTWGTLGSEWGINRTMAQVHALLLIAPEPLSTDDVMEQLRVSRGNANMNLRDLINWNLAERVIKAGDRKEYFRAEKDIWEIARRIAKERKRREIEPLKDVLKELRKVKGDKKDAGVKQFTETVEGLGDFVDKMDKSMDYLLKADEHWFFGTLLKAFK